MGERNADGYGDGQRGDASRQEGQDPGRQNTTARAEEARREQDERVQREHPDFLAARGRDTERDPDVGAPVDADDDSERFRAQENEDESEG